MFFIYQEKIVEITAHFFGRDNAGKKIKIFPVGESRECAGQHPHLDIGCKF